MRKKNVLEIINLFGSATIFIGGQFTYLREKGYNMHLICSPSEGLKAFANEHKIEYEPVLLERQVSVLNDIKAYIRICKFIKKHKIDTVIAHQYKARLIAMLAAVTMRVPNRIIFAHGVLYDTMKGFKRKIFIFVDRFVARMAHKVVCVSPSVMKTRIRDHINKQEKMFLLNKGTCGGIDTKGMFNPNSYPSNDIVVLKKELGIHKDDFIVGFCGRLVRDKGIIELLDGFKLLKETYPDKRIKLLIIGPKEVRDTLPKESFEIINSDKDIIFTGSVERSNMPKYYMLMDVFILPSYREGYPTVVLEAMAMDVPCIVSRSTGCVDSIVEGENGIYTDIEANDIKNKIEKFFNEDFRSHLATNCRKYIVDNYDHSKVWPEVIRIIES